MSTQMDDKQRNPGSQPPPLVQAQLSLPTRQLLAAFDEQPDHDPTHRPPTRRHAFVPAQHRPPSLTSSFFLGRRI
jgi:hypothetical protein